MPYFIRVTKLLEMSKDSCFRFSRAFGKSCIECDIHSQNTGERMPRPCLWFDRASFQKSIPVSLLRSCWNHRLSAAASQVATIINIIMAFSNDPFVWLNFGNVYARSFALLLERLDLFMVIATIMYIPYLLIQFTFPALDQADPTDPATNPLLGDDADGNPTQLLLGPMAALYGELFFSAICGVLGQAAIVLAVGQMYIHGHPDTLVCLKKGFGRFCTLFCGQLIISFGIGFALAICFVIALGLFMTDIGLFKLLAFIVAAGGFVAYFYIAIAMTLYIPAVMIEGKGAIDALKRSVELVSKDFCFVFCTSFCFSLIMGVVSNVIRLFTMDGMLGTALAKLPFLFQFPLSSIIVVVVYFNIRVTHEGLNRDVLARELGSGGMPGSSSNGGGEYDHVLAMDEVVEAEAIAVGEKV
jgi:hypothetical protein